MPDHNPRTWFRLVWSSIFQLRNKPLPAADLPSEVLELLYRMRASALRTYLKAEMARKGGDVELVARILDKARDLGWTQSELDKVMAYAEFFSGNSHLAYARVMSSRLAETDFNLFMTACTHCYLADRYEEGYALLLQFKPENADGLEQGEFLSFAGYITHAAGKGIDEALRYFDLALDMELYSPLLFVNAYPVYFEAGRHDRVKQIRELMHAHCADDPEAIYALACGELARDYYPEGFRLAEHRYLMPEASRSINASLLGKPRWQGQPIAGKRLLVHGEQGFGDLVMMARYLPLLQTQGAEVILECRAAAIPLLAHNFPGVSMIAGQLGQPVTVTFDYWVGIMSLPHLFDATAGSIPATCGYLTVPPEQAAYWQTRVGELSGNEAPRIGIAWSGNPGHRADRRRSVHFAHIAPFLRAHPDVRFFSLQTDVPDAHPGNLANMAEEMPTLADTAALIQGMDLVITVDTSVVHIAGALGKPAWLLLPRRYEWRWGLEGERNNWYDSVRVCRQPGNGDWDSLLNEVFGHCLTEFLTNFKRNQ